MSKLITSFNVEARTQRDWFNLTENSHYAGKLSVYAVNVRETRNGEFYTDVTHVSLPHVLPVDYRSDGFATEAEARADANRVWLAVRDEFIMSSGVRAAGVTTQDRADGIRYSSDYKGSYAYDTDFIAGSASPVLANGEPAYNRQTLCFTCERFDTLHTEMQSYGNLTKCDCGYSHYTSIGD